MEHGELVEKFRAMAAAADAVVADAPDMAAALAYAVGVCDAKPPCEMLAEEPGAATGPLGPNGVPTRARRLLAAPGLGEDDFAILAGLCRQRGIDCLAGGLRERLAGLDVGFSVAELGVAASGTCLVNCTGEDGRLAGMVAETHVIALKKSRIFPDLPSIAGRLRDLMGRGEPTYTTFITGPSRTADIERVAAVGVHGPLALHIVLLEA